MSMINRVGWGGILLISVSLTGCPGYLEEQAWFPDGGRVTYGPPPSADGPIAQRPPMAVAGSSGTPAPVAGTGGGSGSGAGGSGGGGGSGSAAPVKMDGAVRAEAGRAPDGGGAPDGPAAIPLCATAPEITSKILMPKCAGCHRAMAMNPAAGLDLATAGAKMRLVGRMSRCMNKPLVTSDPVGGHLFDKLGGAVTGCGQRMPLMGTPLTPAEIQCMKDWINFIPPPPVSLPRTACPCVPPLRRSARRSSSPGAGPATGRPCPPPGWTWSPQGQKRDS